MSDTARNPQKYIGLPVDEAVRKARAEGFENIIEPGVITTWDMRSDRIRFMAVDGVVTEVHFN